MLDSSTFSDVAAFGLLRWAGNELSWVRCFVVASFKSIHCTVALVALWVEGHITFVFFLLCHWLHWKQYFWDQNEHVNILEDHPKVLQLVLQITWLVCFISFPLWMKIRIQHQRSPCSVVWGEDVEPACSQPSLQRSFRQTQYRRFYQYSH